MSANDGNGEAKGSGGGGGANVGFDTKDEVAAFNEHPAVPIFSKYVEDLLPTFDWFNTKSSPLNVLDYGCGNGINLFKLVRLGHSVTGVDVSKAMIEYVQSKIKDECKQDKNAKNDGSGGGKSDEASSGGPATIYQPTLIHLDTDEIDGNDIFTDATNSMFDLVLVSLVLHHAKDPLEIVKNLSKTLKEDNGGEIGGGKLLIVEFDKTERTEKTRAKISGKGHGGGEHKHGDDGHQSKKMKHDHDHYLDRDEVVKAMTDSGLKIVENKKFTLDVQPPDSIMDCYYVIGHKVDE